jgi:predicted DCC family thiol-disulfide oxidoreductase YuxK
MPAGPRYTIFYDANCRLCARSRRALERLKPRAELSFVDVRDERAMAAHPMVDRREALSQMFVLDPSGRLAGGYDAFLSLAPTVPLLRPLCGVLRQGPVRAVGWRLYRWVARNRFALGGAVSCGGGACGTGVTPGPVPPHAP